MGDWARLSQRLAGVDHSLRLSWSELAELVGGLPPSAAKHRAWWGGDRTHVQVWRAAGFTIDELVLGQGVTFVRTGIVSRPTAEQDGARTQGGAASVEEPSGSDLPDVLLVTCVKTKLGHPAAAKDLYTSALFIRERRYAEALARPWFILSAEHGLVAPDEWLAPYERYLPETSNNYRKAWGHWVVERLDLLAGPLSGKRIEVHASAAYLDAIVGHLQSRGARVVTPLEGLGVGQRLSWYDRQAEQSRSHPVEDPEPPAGLDSAAAFVSCLLARSDAVSPSAFLAARRADLRAPGLYSWWVDEAGSADLSRGLGPSLSAGLIYAGLAGATRWPSGRRSTNTLWARIADMHLGGNHKFSTFRLTLGSILATAEHRDSIDETALTTWMNQHLHVVAIPVDDADTLGRLEHSVLQTLDPPLNLQGMRSTPLRTRISELRRAFGGGR